MTILYPGHIESRPITFHCPFCGCVFLATDREYRPGIETDEDASCICPTCGTAVPHKTDAHQGEAFP